MATEAMIQTLIEMVSTAMNNKAQFALDFRDQFEVMKTKLELMRAFLSSPDSLKTRGEVIQKMLPNLRKLIYEADDILTDCQLRDEYWKDGSTCWNFSLHELSFSWRTGQKLNHINSRIQKIEIELGLRPDLTIKQGDDAHHVIRYSSQDYDSSDGIIGLENDVEMIKGWMLSGNKELHQVGIVGMGSLGKTTIAYKVFNDRDVVAYFEKKIWVPVSQNFAEKRIMKTMLEKLGEKLSASDENNLMHLHQVLTDKKCLIVMDDVWTINADWWKKLCGKSSFVIITSRNEDVTKSMGVDSSRIHRPRLLNEEESWSLFCKFVFSRSGGECSNYQLETVGRDILQKCGRHPLAIKTIGALLAPRVDSLTEWRKINEDFHELTAKQPNNSVSASFQLTYDDLPSHLKQCLLCFSIYPQDFEIDAEQIVLWWVGEGLIREKATRTATELGYEYLSELTSRCLIEVVKRRGYDGRVYSCKMHALIRDMTMKMAKYEAFCNFDEQGQQKLTEDSRWLGFTSNMDPKSLKNCSMLRTLLVMTSNPVFSHRNLELLKSLRVLDLANNKLDTNNVEDLWNWIFSLKRLAHLSLGGVEGLKKVPDSIKKLHNLQNLVLRKCNNLTELHPSIYDLKKVIILDIGSCDRLYLPNGLEKLVHLQELSGFKVMSVADRKSCQLLELQKLTNLRVLRITLSISSEISLNERNVLSNLKKLKVLAIDAELCGDKNVLKMLDMLPPPVSLRELYIEHYHHETLPKWINPMQLPSLQYLSLEYGDAKHLQMSSHDESEDSSGAKWNLEGLRLIFMPNLELDWKNLENDMPLLRYAEVSHCFNLKNFPISSRKPVWRRNQDMEIGDRKLEKATTSTDILS